MRQNEGGGGWEAWLGAGLPVRGGAATPGVTIPRLSFLGCVPGEEFGRSSCSCEVAPRGGRRLSRGLPLVLPPQGWRGSLGSRGCSGEAFRSL